MINKSPRIISCGSSFTSLKLLVLGGGYKSGEIWENLKKSPEICASKNFISIKLLFSLSLQRFRLVDVLINKK